jgi:hypothetical protein
VLLLKDQKTLEIKFYDKRFSGDILIWALVWLNLNFIEKKIRKKIAVLDKIKS